MKNRILFFFFVSFTSFIQQKPKKSKRVDQTLLVRDSIFKEIVKKDSTTMDSTTFFRIFDSLIVAYKISGIYFKQDNSGVNNYFPWGGRIILLDTSSAKTSLTDKLIGELVHAEQFARKPLYYSKKAASAVLNAFTRSILKRKKYKVQAKELMLDRGCSRFVAYLWVAYQEEYSNPKSFEFEAHSIIEPKLKRILWGLPKEKKKEEKIENY